MKFGNWHWPSKLIERNYERNFFEKSYHIKKYLMVATRVKIHFALVLRKFIFYQYNTLVLVIGIGHPK